MFNGRITVFVLVDGVTGLPIRPFCIPYRPPSAWDFDVLEYIREDGSRHEEYLAICDRFFSRFHSG